MKKIAVLYHKNCFDGFGAAWAARKKFGDKAEYIAVEHQNPPPTGLKGKDVYLVDFNYSPEITGKILKEARKLAIMDHHITGKESVKLAHESLYDINHSGAVLAWKFFHPRKRTPRLLLHIEDGDLWRFRLKGTRELQGYLDARDFDFRLWDKVAAALEKSDGGKEYFRQGKAILDYQRKLVKKAVERAAPVKFGGYETLAVNSPFFQSELGNALVLKYPPIGIVWSEKNGKILVSLRSDGKTDVSKIAVKHGGGGHKAASCFSFPAPGPFPWRALKKRKK
ncbi:MAG: hypothetical protein AAB560_00545 [Patescibacteria group bacterium]